MNAVEDDSVKRQRDKLTKVFPYLPYTTRSRLYIVLVAWRVGHTSNSALE